ncbi:MAG TPA: M56 family metallopeptidase, partial [Gemmatimonadaceae bacterium]|nr:M56 family metallopeptidase [Gemmatimonadaceae bacterium]
RVRAETKRSVELVSGAWREAVTRACARLGMTRRVRVLASPHVTMPMAGGILLPTVLVPADATDWSGEQRDIVLAHEIAHLAHADPLRHVAARIAVAIYWFHPLVWLAARNASVAREAACDDAVLQLGIRPSSYARVLLDFAGAPPLRLASATLPMARSSTLETRLMTILSDSRPRVSTRGRGRILVPAAILTTLTFAVAAAQPSRPVAPASAPLAPLAPSAPSVPSATMTTPALIPAPSAPIASAPVATVTALATQQRTGDCDLNRSDSRSFRGSMSTNNGTITEQVGTRGTDRIIQRSFGSLRICAVAIDAADNRQDDLPSTWSSRARRVTLETRDDGDVRTMEISRGETTYSVNGRTRDVDASARAWRDALYELLDRTWELSQLRGQRSSLLGEISSIQGERSSLQGEISSLRGQVSSMRGQISSAQGEESSLRGEISSIRGHESSLRGQISSERGAISSLESDRRYDDRDDRARRLIREHEDRIADLQRQIRDYDTEGKVHDVERRISRLDTDRRVADIDKQIRDFDVERKVADVNRRLDRLDVDGRVRAIERDIDKLDYDRRSRQLEDRVDDALGRLRSALRR